MSKPDEKKFSDIQHATFIFTKKDSLARSERGAIHTRGKRYVRI